MKDIKIILLSGIILLFTIGIQAQQQPLKKADPKIAGASLTSPVDTLQYTLGAFVGQWLMNNGFTMDNPVLFKKGMDDVLQKKPLLVTDSTIVRRIAAYQLSMQSERNRQMEEQLFANTKGKPGVGSLPNGVLYVIMKAGTGIRPTVNDTISINAIGVFPDGTIFEDTFQKKVPIKISTGSLIPGLSEAIQLMPEGSVWRIFIPSALAYGPAGLPSIIPPNSALVFEITLVEVKVGRR